MEALPRHALPYMQRADEAGTCQDMQLQHETNAWMRETHLCPGCFPTLSPAASISVRGTDDAAYAASIYAGRRNDLL